MADKVIPQSLIKVLAEPIEVPRLEEFVSHFYKAAGGPKEMAKIMYTEFLAAPCGSQIRQRMLEMIIRATTNANKMTPSEGDLSLLDEEDLKRMGLKLISELPNDRPDQSSRPGIPAERAKKQEANPQAQAGSGAAADHAGPVGPGTVCPDDGGTEARSEHSRTGDVRP